MNNTNDDRPAVAVPDELQTIYDTLPSIDCKGFCHVYCGPIHMSVLEWYGVQTAAGAPRKLKMDGTCPYLDRKTHRCTVYANRPIICRLWGVSVDLPCIYGCKPERTLSSHECALLVHLVEQVSADATGVTDVHPGPYGSKEEIAAARRKARR